MFLEAPAADVTDGRDERLLDSGCTIAAEKACEMRIDASTPVRVQAHSALYKRSD
jgi:hypothetical protein